jgi:MFS superfamily sulfate permease-like transporter
MTKHRLSGRALSRDLIASVVVFLVALPLSMGVAIASGVPAEKGLVTGVIGGIIVGAISGSPLQVSGPAAGLAVIVFGLVHRFGVAALGPILAAAGVIQFVAGVLRLGQWFRAISPAVVHGMLAGIGVLIVAGQLHVMMDAAARPHGLENILAIPGALMALSPRAFGQTEAAFLTGAASIAVLLAWERLRPARLRLIPGALLGVLAGVVVALGLGVPIKHVEVPASLLAAIAAPSLADFARLADPAMLLTALAVAFIASTETLLSAAAVDKMQDGVRAKFNKELSAQGVGNFLCGLCGALPMTGVIVRSSANVQAGAQTRVSAIMHGVWILAVVALAPGLLRQIPTSALAGVLVVTGWRLVDLRDLAHLYRTYGRLPALIWIATFATVIAVDLLAGVLVGLALAALELAPHLRDVRRLRLRARQTRRADATHIGLSGKATFLSLPKLSKSLEAAPEFGPVVLEVGGLDHLDHTSLELIRDWIQRKRRAGSKVSIRPAGAVLARALEPAHPSRGTVAPRQD